MFWTSRPKLGLPRSTRRFGRSCGARFSRAMRERARVPVLVWQALPGLAVLVVWQWGATVGWLDKFFFSRPSAIGARLLQWIADGTIWVDLGVTLAEAALSFTIGVVAGIVIGCLLARVTFLSKMFDPYI